MNLSVCLLIARLAFAGTCGADELDDYIRASMKTNSVPAIVFGVFKDGSILRSGAFGLANVELKVPATVNTVFEIGSVTKQFTATLVLMLMDEGKLALNDRIDNYLDHLPDAWRAVTIRQLLNHTSGIPDIEDIFGYDSYRNIYTFDQIIAVANSKPMDFPPGTKMRYSNTGYFLLGHILQKIESKPYDEILHERILNPLGMIHTRQSDPAFVILGRCAGYQLTDRGLANRDAMQPTACLAAGTIVSTIGDMAKWDSAITHNRFLKPAIQKLMWEKTRLPNGETNSYGMGWFIDDWRGHPCVEHSGGTAGFSCDYRRFQDLDLSVVVFCNLYSGTATGIGNVECRAVNAVHPGLSYISYKPIKDDPKIRDMLLKAMADVAKGGAGSPSITEAMWKAYPDVSRKEWRERLAHLRSFQLLEHTRHAPVDSGHGEKAVETYVYRLETGGKTLFIIFDLTAEGKIALQRRVEN
jgi:CubicO group peptidase (beta-lactamase class C family)